MRLSLRTKILFFTVLPIVTLVFATLWMLNHRLTRQVSQGIHDDLRRASAVVENALEARDRALELASLVIVQDPKFFSVLTIPGSERDAQLRATVAGVASDFNSITQADLFEVMDVAGHGLASVGRETSDARDRQVLVQAALAGRPVRGILASAGGFLQVQATPVFAGGRVIGALLLGARIDGAFAEQLKSMTRSEVTFVSRGQSTASTLERGEDRLAAVQATGRLGAGAMPAGSTGEVLEVRAPAHTYLTLIRPLPESEHGERQTYVMQRSLDVEMAFLREMQTGLLELGVVALLVALLAGALIAERITSPVQRLVRGAEEMERGNYEFPLDVRSRDEIGYLATRFHDMRQKQRDYVGRLEEAARLKSEFISVASHELRTPISIIRGFQELMVQGHLGPVSGEQREALGTIGRSLDGLTRLAEDATRMAQIEDQDLTLSRSECSVKGLIEEAVRAARVDAPGRQVQVCLDVEEGLGTVWVDGPRLGQAVANLVRNGIRFTRDEGQVSVRARATRGALEIAVQDTGIGIARDKQAHLFERAGMVRDSLHHHSSSTLEFNSAGLGLGLSIARGIVAAHGGTILVDSEVGRGSTFTLLIPLEREPALALTA